MAPRRVSDWLDDPFLITEVLVVLSRQDHREGCTADVRQKPSQECRWLVRARGLLGITRVLDCYLAFLLRFIRVVYVWWYVCQSFRMCHGGAGGMVGHTLKPLGLFAKKSGSNILR
jgi:hypothetical protein